MTAIAYSTTRKTFAVVSPDLAKSMLFMGNPHHYDRATEFPDSAVSQMIEVFTANGFKNETHNPA